MSNQRVQCKFFAHGACLKGEHCEFAHDWNAPTNNICTFYQKGVCTYGSRCRYEHVKVPHSQSSDSSSATSFKQSASHSLGSVSIGIRPMPNAPAELSSLCKPLFSSSTPAWSRVPEHHEFLDGDHVEELEIISPADRSICSFAAAGHCPRGDKCPHVHGDLCPFCGNQCLHPSKPEERVEHLKSCQKKQKQLEALKASQEIECSVCLERVLSKATAAERKFGILSECDHPFCISCIRNWRSSSPSSGVDVNSTLRSCPICRKVSYFVIPSVIWYTAKEEKEEILESYKTKLRSIDCRHFDFGNGSCPFGSSCFYKHAYRDGRLEEVVLRHLGAEDGQTVIAKNIRRSLLEFSQLCLKAVNHILISTPKKHFASFEEDELVSFRLTNLAWYLFS